MSGLLEEILANKRREVEAAKQKRTLDELQEACCEVGPCRGFAAALTADRSKLAVIAEAKRKSPSAGDLKAGDDISARARMYQQGGAACVSVLTDMRYFGGCNEHLGEARRACSLPLLRKDFIVDEWQVFETRAIGADCMLLIAAALDPDELRELTSIGHEIGLDVLVEIHSAAEIEPALDSGSSLIGINNRNLDTLANDLATTEKLALLLRGNSLTLVSESAIHTGRDADYAAGAGVDAVLVGEALMRSDDPASLLGELQVARPSILARKECRFD